MSAKRWTRKTEYTMEESLPAKKKTAAKAASKPSMSTPLKGRLNLITCVLQRGKANDVAKAAMQAGAKGATVVYGRGMGVGELMGALGFAIVPQKEVIQIVTTADSTKKLFDVVVQAAELDKPGMGIAYIIPISEAAGLFQ
jgi:nitrogen regulatory protein PII